MRYSSSVPVKTKLRLAALLGLFLNLGASSLAQAYEAKMPAYIRDHDGKLVLQEVTLTDLTRPDAFEGKYFKVVKGSGEDNTPVSFKDPTPAQQSTPGSPDIRIKAASVYYAFTISRLYFKDLLSRVGGLTTEQLAYLDEPVTIRLEMTNVYSDSIHFNLAAPPVHNGALTIPASDPDSKVDVNPKTQQPIADWGRETWFFAPKKEPSFATAQLIGATIGQSSFRLQVLESLLSQDVTLAIKDEIVKQFAWHVFAENAAFSVAISEGAIPVLSKVLSQFPTHVYLDTAVIPEIVANEYAHIALYKWLGLKRSSNIVEGYPHYFAARIWGLNKLQDRATPFSKGQTALDSGSKVKYSDAQENGQIATQSSFTYALLSQIDQELGTDEGDLVLTRAIISPYFMGDQAIGYVGPESDMKVILENALLGAAQKYGQRPDADTDILLSIFDYRQM